MYILQLRFMASCFYSRIILSYLQIFVVPVIFLEILFNSAGGRNNCFVSLLQSIRDVPCVKTLASKASPTP